MNNNFNELYTDYKCYPGEKSPYDKWTRGNVAEAFPDVMTPLSWSLWSNTMNELLRNAFRYYSFFPSVKKKCFIMLKEGKLYYNIGLVNHYMKKIGLFPMDAIIGGETAYNLNTEKYQINWFRFLFHFIGNIRSERNNKELEKISPIKWTEFEKKHYEWKMIDYDSYKLVELLTLFEERISYGMENMFLHTDATTAAFSKMAILQWKLNKYGYSDEILLEVLNSVNDIKMANLSAVIEDLRNRIRSKKDKEKIIECLKCENWKGSLNSAGYCDICEYIENNIIQNYGHRGKNELEIKEKCWSESPRMLIEIIIDRLVNDNIKRESKFQKNFNDKRITPLIEKTKIFTRLRENNKHYLYYIIEDIKRIMRIIDKKMRIEISELEDGDIYFMTYNELKDVISCKKRITHFKKIITERKRIYLKFISTIENSANEGEKDNKLYGITACKGIVRGKVRIFDKNNVNCIEKGDIIVIKSLDISCTPLFSIAGGVITELGGILSHAAIIAREYNIPTIVNIKNATSVLRDGEDILLNADKGFIEYDRN